MLIELSPPVYLALCALVQDTLQHPSDATPLLKLAQKELASSAEEVAEEFTDQPQRAAAFRRAAGS